MRLIPVIDIRNGVAVRAIAGRRSDYQPLATPLARTSAPLDVARGLMKLHRFQELYIADLDAIERRGDNRGLIEKIGDAFPQLRLWVDAGVRDREDVERWLSMREATIVIGAESFVDASALDSLRADRRLALSLDFQGERFLGAPRLLADERLWPQRVIVMTLARVGGGEGPDVARVRDIVARAPARDIYGAGGVRGVDDLLRLQDAGAAGALVSSALHDGRLTPVDLARFDAN